MLYIAITAGEENNCKREGLWKRRYLYLQIVMWEKSIGSKLDHVCSQAEDNGGGNGMNLHLAAHTWLGVCKCHAEA